uniref:Uncharacterized protein n=2 Tax=Ixodes ricinus TaxID=34613 RepID=A0A147BC46_IXORI
MRALTRSYPVRAFFLICLDVVVARQAWNEEVRRQMTGPHDDFPAGKLWPDHRNWRPSPFVTAGAIAAVVFGCLLLIAFIFACVIWCCKQGSVTAITEPLVQSSHHVTEGYAAPTSSVDHLYPPGSLPCGQPWSQAPFYQQPYRHPEPHPPPYLVPTAESAASMPPAPPPYDYKDGLRY